jgi:hypothetical protein
VPIVAESLSKHTAQTAHVHRENYVAHMFVRQAPAGPFTLACEDRGQSFNQLWKSAGSWQENSKNRRNLSEKEAALSNPS